MSTAAQTPLRERAKRTVTGRPAPEGEEAAVTAYAPAPAQPVQSIVRVQRPAPAPRNGAGSADSSQARSDYEWAQIMAQSGLLDKQFRGKPQNILWVIGWARAVDMPIMTALQSIYVSKAGKPSMTAHLMNALIRRAGHKLYVRTDTTSDNVYDWKATAELIRAEDVDQWRGGDERVVFTSEWTMLRAARAHLVKVVENRPRARSKDGDPLPWELYPANLLKARGISEVGRDGAADVLMGIPYTPEETGVEWVDRDGTPMQVHAADLAPEEIDQEYHFGAFEGETGDEIGSFDGLPDPGDIAQDGAPGPEGPGYGWEDAIRECVDDRDLDGLRDLYTRAARDAATEPGLAEKFTRAAEEITAA